MEVPEDTEAPDTVDTMVVVLADTVLAATVAEPADTVELAVLEDMVSAEASEASAAALEASVVELEDSAADPCLFRASRFTTPEVLVEPAATEAPVPTAEPELIAVVEAMVLEATVVLEATAAPEATVGQAATVEPEDTVALEAIPSTAVALAAQEAGSGKVKSVCVCAELGVCAWKFVSPSMCLRSHLYVFRRRVFHSKLVSELSEGPILGHSFSRCMHRCGAVTLLVHCI